MQPKPTHESYKEFQRTHPNGVRAKDYGTELNNRIRAAKARIRKLQDQLDAEEALLGDLVHEQVDAQKECGTCNDCSMCLG